MDDNKTVKRKVTMKGKVNGSKVLGALALLGMIVLNVVHVMHK